MEMEPTEKTFFITIYQPFSVMGGGEGGGFDGKKGGRGALVNNGHQKMKKDCTTTYTRWTATKTTRDGKPVRQRPTTSGPGIVPTPFYMED
jgi:hypothetical protein